MENEILTDDFYINYFNKFKDYLKYTKKPYKLLNGISVAYVTLLPTVELDGVKYGFKNMLVLAPHNGVKSFISFETDDLVRDGKYLYERSPKLRELILE